MAAYATTSERVGCTASLNLLEHILSDLESDATTFEPAMIAAVEQMMDITIWPATATTRITAVLDTCGSDQGSMEPLLGKLVPVMEEGATVVGKPPAKTMALKGTTTATSEGGSEA